VTDEHRYDLRELSTEAQILGYFAGRGLQPNAIKLRQTYGETNTPQVNFYYNLQRPARYGSPRRSDFYAARYGIGFATPSGCLASVKIPGNL